MDDHDGWHSHKRAGPHSRVSTDLSHLRHVGGHDAMQRLREAEAYRFAIDVTEGLADLVNCLRRAQGHLVFERKTIEILNFFGRS